MRGFMNYESMSDFEINKAAFLLAAKLGLLDFEDVMQNKNPDSDAVMYGDGANWYAWNGCNNPSDAWTIIIENEISIVDPVSCGLDEKWIASKFYPKFNKKDIDWDDKNPLRAAMIVFLRMNEGEVL